MRETPLSSPPVRTGSTSGSSSTSFKNPGSSQSTPGSVFPCPPLAFCEMECPGHLCTVLLPSVEICTPRAKSRTSCGTVQRNSDGTVKSENKSTSPCISPTLLLGDFLLSSSRHCDCWLSFCMLVFVYLFFLLYVWLLHVGTGWYARTLHSQPIRSQPFCPQEP